DVQRVGGGRGARAVIGRRHGEAIIACRGGRAADDARGAVERQPSGKRACRDGIGHGAGAARRGNGGGVGNILFASGERASSRGQGDNRASLYRDFKDFSVNRQREGGLHDVVRVAIVRLGGH